MNKAGAIKQRETKKQDFFFFKSVAHSLHVCLSICVLQVRCGSVYVSSEDSTQAVTQTVVTATSVAEKKRRASKYTVAIGTSHGHGEWLDVW